MSETSRLHLPHIMPSQAQKHVTVNEALGMIDALVQLSVRDRDLAAPPVSPAEGDRYIVGPGAGGGWTGREGVIAEFLDGGWRFHAPAPGWLAWVEDEGEILVWTGTGWVSSTARTKALQNLSLLGVGTMADAANPFAAKLNKALWTARTVGEGGDGDLRYTLNKETAADTLSVLMQSAWSGRAELGLIGNDDFRLKVSGDGAVWRDSFVVNATTAVADFKVAPTVNGGKLWHVGNDGAGSGLVADTVRGYVPPDPAAGARITGRWAMGAAVGSIANATGGQGALEVLGAGAADAAFISFHRPGAFAAYFGLDTDNVWKVGGWSMGGVAHQLYHGGMGALLPSADNAQSVGTASRRMKEIFAVSGTINTSDGREKTARRELSDAELRAWGRVRFGIFQWLEAISEKGEEGARLHTGLIAQEVEAAFAAEGLDASRYALWCADELFEPETVSEAQLRPSIREESIQVVVEERDGDRIVQRIETRTEVVPVMVSLPVIGPTGEPVLDGDGAPEMRCVQETEAVQVERQVMRPTGRSRLGLRYEECLAFEAAYQRCRVDALQGRVAALEGAG